jgi:hypothetical protein
MGSLFNSVLIALALFGNPTTGQDHGSSNQERPTAAAVSNPCELKNRGSQNTPIQKHPLIVVHASRAFDTIEYGYTAPPAVPATKGGTDLVIKRFKENGLPIFFLDNWQDATNDCDWYTHDRTPTKTIFSSGGQHKLPIIHSEVTIVGGYAASCHGVAVDNAINQYFLTQKGPLTINLPLDAIFSRHFINHFRLLEEKLAIDNHKVWKDYSLPMGEIYKYVTDKQKTASSQEVKDLQARLMEFLGVVVPYNKELQHEYYLDGNLIHPRRQLEVEKEKKLIIKFWTSSNLIPLN